MKHLFGHRRELPREEGKEDYAPENWDEEPDESFVADDWEYDYDITEDETEHFEDEDIPEYETEYDEEEYIPEDETEYFEDEDVPEDDAEYGDDEDMVYEEDWEETQSEYTGKVAPIHRGGIASFRRGLEKTDRFMIGAVAAVLVLVLATAGVYVSARFSTAQTAEFSEVGSQLDGIEIIGEKGLLAMADAEAARAAAAAVVAEEAEEQTREYTESDYDQSVTVVLKTVSVQRDLKIKFVNQKTEKLIPNVPFSVTVTDPDGKSSTWTDDDMDGIIYKKSITSGTYKLAVNELAGTAYADYTLPADAQTADVKKDIAYQKIDVSDEVKTEAQINTATEEQQNKNIEVESTLTDTVTWVESTEVENTYLEVSSSDMSALADELVSVSTGDVSVDGTVSTSPQEDTTTKLTDKDGNQLYVLEDGSYREAVYADYYKENMEFFRKGDSKYTGWQTIDGKVYFFDASGNKVTGEQVIQGVTYTFDSDGALVTSNGTLGIDVSKHNGTIDWTAVKNSGVSYVIIRCGYRGYTQGSLVIDSKFKANIQGATAAGLKVGVYFFSQAVDEVEAVEEASFVLDCVKGYTISYPIFLDVEYSGASGNKGRADGLDKATRTAVCLAFCNTIRNAGYTAGIYANKTWLTSKIDVSQLSACKIWLAQYAATPTYTGRYDMWQYKSTGKVSGISGNVDMNLSYLGY